MSQRSLRGHQIARAKETGFISQRLARAPKPSTLDFYAIRFSPRHHVAKTDNVVDLHLHGTLPEVLAPQILNLQSGQPSPAPETILCSEFIESELEITTTYGPQMFVARLRIIFAR